MLIKYQIIIPLSPTSHPTLISWLSHFDPAPGAYLMTKHPPS